MSVQPSVKSKFINGVLWGIIEKLASLLTGFIITLVLARILTPEDYGLINMIYIFTVLGNVLLDGGFGQAIIQKQSVSNKDISSVFYLNLILSAVIYTILFFCAPLIARFYNQESLISISKVVFITIPINAVCIIQHTLLTKEMKVKELTYVSILSSLISGGIGIWMAYKGYGVWALVYQSVAFQGARAVLLWVFSKWRPVFQFSVQFIKSIFGFSMNLLGVFTLAAVFQNIYTLLIGKFYNINEVGYYNQAYRVQTVASNAIMSSIQRVAFPAFSHFQDDLPALKAVYRRVTVITMSVYFPFMMLLIVVGNNLFDVLLTEKWLPSVPMFYLLCIAEAFYPLNNINSSVLKALGKGRKYLLLNFANYAIITVSIVLTYRYGIIYLLLGYTFSALIQSIMSMIVCGNEINYKLTEQLKDLIPIFIITVIVCSGAYIPNILGINIITQLTLSSVFGIAIFVILNFITKSQLYFEVTALINRRK